MKELFDLFQPGNTAIYLAAILCGLYVQFQGAKANKRTLATSFSEYWLKETPGMSLATFVSLATAAGAIIQSGMLASMTGMAVFVMGFGKGYVFDAMIQAPSSPSAEAAPKAPAQAGFARLGMLFVLVALLSPLLAGCPSMPTLPDSKTLPSAGNIALKAIVSANAALDTAYDFIGSGMRTGAIEPKQGRTWFITLDEYKAKVKAAQDLFDAGGFDAAKAQAAGTEALIKFLHDQAIKSLQEKARGSVTWYPEEPGHCPCIRLYDAALGRDLKPTIRSLAWMPQPQN